MNNELLLSVKCFLLVIDGASKLGNEILEVPLLPSEIDSIIKSEEYQL